MKELIRNILKEEVSRKYDKPTPKVEQLVYRWLNDYFDGYDYYLYYSSESLAYPKTNSTPPYTLYSSTSPTVLTWLGSADENNAYYGGILLTASIYDNLNQNNLFYAIPEYLREDPANDPWGDQGNFAGDKLVNLGGVSINNIR